MKRVLGFIFLIVILFSLTGCNREQKEELLKMPDKDPLISAVITAKQIDTTAYIPTSVDPLSSAIQHANSVISDENATQSDVDTAAKNLENCINGLVKATNGIYKIFYSLTLIDSNSVGNEWSKSITCNGSLIESGDTVTVPLNSAITITGTVTEHDSVPDYGSGSIRLTADGSTQSKTIYVRENRGRYSGNLAVWRLDCSMELLSTQ